MLLGIHSICVHCGSFLGHFRGGTFVEESREVCMFDGAEEVDKLLEDKPRTKMVSATTRFSPPRANASTCDSATNIWEQDLLSTILFLRGDL